MRVILPRSWIEFSDINERVILPQGCVTLPRMMCDGNMRRGSVRTRENIFKK